MEWNRTKRLVAGVLLSFAATSFSMAASPVYEFHFDGSGTTAVDTGSSGMANWFTLTNFFGTDGNIHVRDDQSLPTAFYRVIAN